MMFPFRRYYTSEEYFNFKNKKRGSFNLPISYAIDQFFDVDGMEGEEIYYTSILKPKRIKNIINENNRNWRRTWIPKVEKNI